MKKSKGFTLIEIIVAIAVLGIISMSFLGAMASHFGFLNRTKRITNDVFLAQREMEEKIDEVKEQIRKDELELKKKTIFASALGGVEVEYYEVEETFKGKGYYALVSNIKPDPLELVELESLGIKLKQGENQVSYGYGTSNFSIIGNFRNLEKYKYDHLLNQVEWYVSSDEYNIPMPKDPDFDLNDDILYNSYYFPLFPRDYILIDNETIYKFGSSETAFKHLSDYAGRHIIFTVTPAAKSGKLGIQSVSDPIFISGLPITDNLIMHFDAAYIDILDTNEVQNVGDDYYVSKWIDLSSIIGQDNPNESATPGTYNKPLAKRTDMGSGFIGQYVRFNIDQYLEVNAQNTNERTLYIVSVVKNRSKTDETKFLQNGSIELKLPPNDNDYDYEWTITTDVFVSDSNNFLIGGPYVDIAEIIVYNEVLDEDKINKVQSYLAEKYKAPTVIGDIVQLKDMSEEIKVGDSFELPTMVLAEMSRGTEKYVSVSWSGSYDTNTPGTYEIIGSALANPTKKMTFTLTVVE